MKKENSITILEERIMRKIYVIRGQKVMLDRDLAELYGVKPIRLREQVKRNRYRFPDDFMFQLGGDEVKMMVSHFAIPSKKHLGGHSPYVFTEHGVLMLANVIKSRVANDISILIIRVFIKLKERLSQNTDLKSEIQRIEDKFDKKVGLISEVVKRLVEKDEGSSISVGINKKKIGFNEK